MASRVDKIKELVEDIQLKMDSEDKQIIEESIELAKLERSNDINHWDISKDTKIDFFDPTLSYELTGYRPIDQTHGLDFNPSWFTETRDFFLKTGHYCPYLPGSKRYNEFWKEQYVRCKYGMSVNGYTITGDNYFFLNFYQLPVIDSSKAAGEGIDESFPNFMASQYMFFHYLNLCRITKRNACLMKARSIGFSEINASVAARMYFIFKKSRTMIACHKDIYVKDTFAKFKHAVTFLNTSTDGGMFQPELISQELRIKSGYQEKINGLFEDFGFQSEVIGINADKPNKIRGKRLDLLIYDEAGCHIAGTQVIMFDGTLKNVENIKIGDVLMGPDGKPRTVIELHSGQDLMYKIIPNNGDELIVNSNHILYGSKYNYSKKTFTPFEMKTKDYYDMVANYPRKKDGYKLQKSILNWETTKLPINPYLFGFWLGDGDKSKARFTSKDPEIIEFLEQYAKSHNSKISKYECENSKNCYHITFLKKDGETTNWFCDKLKEIGVFNNKHIPYWYICNDKQSRLSLLAGLIDSDGNYNENKHCIEITQYEDHKQIIEQATFIARSLGMKVSTDTRLSKVRTINNKIVKGGVLQYRMRILSGYEEIPTIIERKRPKEFIMSNKGSCDKLTTNFKIEKYQIDTYYGFTLKEDPLFLLKDFTIVHNSWPDLKTAVVQGRALCEVQGEVRGVLLYGGTGGDIGAPLAGLKAIYEKPRSYKVLPFRHSWTPDGTITETGFFIPYFLQSLKLQYMDERGVCKIDEYKKYLLEERDIHLEDPEAYAKHCAENCWYAEEAFLLEGLNKFNKVNITNQLADIRLHKIGPKPEIGSLTYIFKTNKHSVDNINGFRWQPNPNSKILILEHPRWSEYYKLEKDEPRLDVMNDLYVAGIDGIDIGMNQTSSETRSPSDFCLVIKRRAFGLSEPQIVCIYKDRPGNIREAYKNAMCLIRYYNCKVNIEATRVGFLTWARENDGLQYFMRRPRATLGDIKYGKSNTYGTPATKTIIELQTDLIADFVEDYCHTIWFEEVLSLLLEYNDENKTKFDIIAALGMVELADLELSGRVPKKTAPVSEEWLDFGYYTDERGYKKYGIIPKKKSFTTLIQELEDDPYTIETSDPRLYERQVPGRISWRYSD